MVLPDSPYVEGCPLTGTCSDTAAQIPADLHPAAGNSLSSTGALHYMLNIFIPFLTKIWITMLY